ncbi:MAG TPA: hypothetical protein VGQ79_06350 [Nitrospiraceae bacterium]|nr:hypothetical protein [Nitrospiraceae bacterium]
MKLTAIASPICLVFISLMVTAAELSEARMPLPETSAEATSGATAAPSTATVESPHTPPLDRKSFKTIPFDPAPSDTQRRELERVVVLCIQTVDREVPGGHFAAFVDGGIVSTVGIDRERFKFWKCMSQNGHPLAPINK